jgi:iron complex transport system ATP-binding protein
MYSFRADGLCVGYNGKPIIKNIEFHLRPGQILTLIGPNGSGKSTVLKTVAKNLKKIGGAVYMGNLSIDDMNNKDISRKAAVVLTERPRTELTTCEEIVETGRYPYAGALGILSPRDREAVENALDTVGARELRDKDFTQISDGQRQRIMLARALCQEPQIIILDEPTSFLDVRYKIEIPNILRTLAKEKNITIVMSLHELDMAQRVSDIVMCVKGEYVESCGTPREIFNKEHIHKLYDLSNGNYNPLFGSFELEAPKGEPKVFVIAGGGAGIAEYRVLQKRKIPFATGILHENDVDYQVARDLAAETIGEKSFEKIGEVAFHKALERLKSCDYVINLLKSYGEINAKNKELYEFAVSCGKKILESAEEII